MEQDITAELNIVNRFVIEKSGEGFSFKHNSVSGNELVHIANKMDKNGLPNSMVELTKGVRLVLEVVKQVIAKEGIASVLPTRKEVEVKVILTLGDDNIVELIEAFDPKEFRRLKQSNVVWSIKNRHAFNDRFLIIPESLVHLNNPLSGVAVSTKLY